MFNFKRGISMLAVVGALVIGSVAPVYLCRECRRRRLGLWNDDC